MARENQSDLIARLVAESVAATVPTIIAALRGDTIAPAVAAQIVATDAPNTHQETRMARIATPTKPAATVNDKLAKLDILSRDTVTGTIAKIHRSGGSAWLTETDETYFNGSKLTDLMPFKKYAVGDRVTIGTITYAQDSEQYPERTIVESVKPFTSPNGRVKAQPVKAQPVKAQPVKAQPVKAQPVKAQPVKAQPVKAQPVKTADATGLAAIRQSVPSSKRPEGCPFCNGAVHGNVGSGTAANECQIRQYVKATGEPFQPWKSESLRALADWKDAQRSLRVSKGNDDTVGVDIATKTPLAPTTPPVAATAAPRRAAAPAKNAAPATSDSLLTGKVLKVNAAGTKIQFQPTGKLFMWASADAKIVKTATKLLGKLGQATVQTRIVDEKNVNVITALVAAPKA